MPPKTEAELALQKKYELLRKKKEAKLKEQEQQQADKGSAPVKPAAAPVAAALPRKPAPVQPAPANAGKTAHERARKALLGQKASSSGKPPLASSAQRPKQPSGAASAPARNAAERGEHGAAQRDTAQQPAAPRPPVASAAPAPAERLDPVAAAKQRLAAEASKQQRPSSGPARPSLKRPSSRPAARPDEPPEKRHRHEDSQLLAQSSGSQESTLFVGDLPPHFTAGDLQDVFSSLGTIMEARVVGTQCYGFVTFDSEDEAAEALEMTAMHPIDVAGYRLRVNRAKGSLPNWKKSPAVVRPRQPGEYLEGMGSAQQAYHAQQLQDELDHQYEHPKVREARLAAQAAAEAIAAGHRPFDGAPLPGMEGGPPPERQLVVYDDL
ncbi:hypothetical protein WJX72_002714 [[Myrmecia] bisecta]|uniref:RRM domain-containing protein n=1 Tax=[Myrmecia] bisecta TaxID=41462 RepID=A0AAW1Q3P6_9CHLO